ncbi:MAG: hypothetical protein ACK2UE_17035 [Anaerolineales bacterium]
MRAVWMVRLPKIKSQIIFWLSTLGYQYQDRSLTNRLYFLYFLAFWSVWFLAVFFFLAGGIVALLDSMHASNLNFALLVAAALLFIIWVLVELFRVSLSSPFIFSEADVHLVCQTPIDRRKVALVWFLSDWFETAIFFWAGAVVLGFTFAELQIEGSLGLSEMYLYLYYSSRAFLIILFLQFAFQALIWSFGTTRLIGKRGVPWLPLIPLGLIVWFLIHIITNLGNEIWQAVLSYPLLSSIYYPFQAIPGKIDFVVGLMVSMSLAILSLSIFWMVTRKLNLSRAAAETHQKESIQTAVRYGKDELAQEMQQQKRLGPGRNPTKMPEMPGIWSLLWKEALQAFRSLNLEQIAGWLMIFGLGLGILLIPEWSLRGLTLIIWITIVGDRATKHLRDDLAHWWLFRLLPFLGSRMVLVDLLVPWAGNVIMGWLVLLILGKIIAPYASLLAGLLPFIVAGIILSTADDILHQSAASLLLVGEVPRQRALASFLGVLLVAIPAAFFWWLREFPYLGSILALLILLVMDYLLWRDLTRVYRRIE